MYFCNVFICRSPFLFYNLGYTIRDVEEMLRKANGTRKTTQEGDAAFSFRYLRGW